MLKRTLQIFGLAFLFGLFLTLGAYAGVNLKKVQVSSGNQVDLHFDQKITPGQVQVEYLRDIIQISLKNVSVYPAKVSTVTGSELSKVFAYQYSPELVRCRLTVKGDSAQYQNRVQMKISGKTVTLRIDPNAAPVAKEAEKVEAPQPVAAKTELNAEEKQLLDRVTKNEKTKAESKSAAKVERKSKETKADSQQTSRLTNGKGLPTPAKSLGMMLFTIGLLGGFLLFLKKAKGNKLFKSEAKGLSKFLGKLTGGASRGMIEVVATHHLAPKKSIVMVKIQDRMLVLGMTNDSVNLITEFKANDDEAEGEESMNVRAFADGLKNFEGAQKGAATAREEANAFAGILTKAFGKATGNASSTGNVTANAPVSSNEKPEPKLNVRPQAAYSAQKNRSASANEFAESPALAAALNQASTKTSIRAQIRSKVEGMKSL